MNIGTDRHTILGTGAAMRAARATAKAIDRTNSMGDIATSAKAVINGALDQCKNSFDADTPLAIPDEAVPIADVTVATPDGAVPIADVTIGATVYAWDEATQTTGVYTVTDTINHVDPLITPGGGGR